jgi:hypothetical protein
MNPIVPNAKKTDSEIQQAVAREMEWDTRVSPTEVGIQVKQGVVTLNGMVDSWVKVRRISTSRRTTLGRIACAALAKASERARASRGASLRGVTVARSPAARDGIGPAPIINALIASE